MRRKYQTSALEFALAAVLFAGCASEQRKEAAMAHMGDETPPAFLTGPASAVLAGFDGFSADVVAASPSSPAAWLATGQVIERQGRLIFQPTTTANIKKGKIVRGGMYFIWDNAAHKGFVVSEALQGFAPITPPRQVASVAPESNQPAPEQVNGHPCHRLEKKVVFSDGSTAKLTEWQADDLNRFPVRLRTESGGREETVDFSGVRFDVPSPELFAPPGDFTQYASPAALISELIIRESTFRTGPIGQTNQGLPANWREPGLGH
jgi:hypothetical protein